MQPETDPHQRTVLCVDADCESTAAYAASMSAEYQLTIAATACDALRLSNERSFDAFILEFWIPDWTGVSLCRQIRKSDPHVPVIFSTAARKDADRDRAVRAGASAYLVKPVDPPLLSSKLRGLLALATADAARARVAAQRAVEAELERRLKACREGLSTALGGAERAARKKALDAFTQAGGTHAMFSRTWPEMLIGGQAAAADTWRGAASSASTSNERFMAGSSAGSHTAGPRGAA